MEKFLEIFNNKKFNDFIDRTYVSIEHIENPRNIKNISNEVDTLIKTFPISTKNSPYAGIYGLPGSGKSTLARQVSEECSIPVISTDKFLADLREQNPDFPPAKHNDEFRKHEYKVICCLFLSGFAENKIIDFGGAALLQSGLGLISKNVLGDALINLKIDDEERIFHLMQDAVLEQGYRTVIKNQVNELKEENKEKFGQLQQYFVSLIKEHRNLKNVRQKLEELVDGKVLLSFFNNIEEICRNFDAEKSQWRQPIYDRYSKSINYEEAGTILERRANLDRSVRSIGAV
ncbi:MAG: hypothetical protein J6C50_02300 [Rickettsiales bacterium]|nr:hypothetical protein [Rickettsiales bacterium]